MLQERYHLEHLKNILTLRKDWRPFPKSTTRAEIKALLRFPINQRRQAYLTGYAEACLNTPWPPLPATLYMDFRRTGNRRNFETPYFERRQRLALLTLAELFEGQGRFLDDIVNGIWAICEETTWCIPAHAWTSSNADPLPDIGRHRVDLFACETARTLAETFYLLENELQALSPAIIDRIRQQVIEQVIAPIEQHAELYRFNSSSNWNAWRTANILWAALVLLEDGDRLVHLVYKLMGFMDNFLRSYAQHWPDGGCAEGPTYWNVATGKLIEFLEWLYSRTAGQISIYDEPLIREMCLFISRAHLAGPYFASFADADPQPWLNHAAIYRCGERLGLEELKNMALLAMRNWKAENIEEISRRRYAFVSLLPEICWIPPDAHPTSIAKPLEVWLSNVEVAVWRENSQGENGLVVAAKAGNNHEPHNHNDVGQFIVIYNCQPILIDIGRPEYRQETFSQERYDIWPINAWAHNVPRINGHLQLAGTRDVRRAATNVAFYKEGNASILSMELTSCYAAEAGIKILTRLMRFAWNPAVFTVTDSYAMHQAIPPIIEIPLYTAVPCILSNATTVVFKTNAGDVRMIFNPNELSVSIATVTITDAAVRASWPGGLWLITLRHAATAANGTYSITFRAQDNYEN